MNPNEVEKRLREIAERENKATNGPWKNSDYRPGQIIRRDPSERTYEFGDDKFAPILWVSGSPFQQHNDQDFIAHSRQDVPWLLALIKKQREALEADALADKLFERAEAHREDSIACGYNNDPTGSLAVTESYKAANEQALIADQLKRDALNFSPENL